MELSDRGASGADRPGDGQLSSGNPGLAEVGPPITDGRNDSDRADRGGASDEDADEDEAGTDRDEDEAGTDRDETMRNTTDNRTGRPSDLIEPDRPPAGVQEYTTPAAATAGASAQVNQTYNLTADDPGAVRVSINYTISSGVSSFSEYVYDSETVLGKHGFTRDGNDLEWDGTTAEPWVVLRRSVNDSGTYGMNEVDVGDWAFFTLHSPWYEDAEVTMDAAGNQFTAADYWAFLGDQNATRYAGARQNFTIVNPAAATPAVSPDRTFDQLDRASQQFQVGADSVDDNLTVFLAPDPIRRGGAAIYSEFWVHVDTDFQYESTYLHEYVHTRQDDLDVTYGENESTGWTREGTASMYGSLLNWRLNNTINFGDLKHSKIAPFVLANASTYNGARPGYGQGKGVLIALDDRIRNATDGTRSFQDVFREMAARGDSINASELQSIAEAVAGRSFQTFFDRYVYDDRSFPVPPTPDAYEFVETDPINVTTTRSGGTPTGHVVIGDTSAGIGNLFDSGLPARPHNPGRAYAAAQVDGTGSVSIPVEPFHRTGVWNRYRAYYLQADSDGTLFPRDGTTDIVLGPTVDSLPFDGSFAVDDETPRRITAAVVNETGHPMSDASISVTLDRFSVRLVATSDGYFLDRDGVRGLELGDGVAVNPIHRDSDTVFSTPLPNGTALDARFVLRSAMPPLAVTGTAVPRNLTAGESQTVSIMVSADDADTGVTRTVSVDGEPVTDVDIAASERYGAWTMPVPVTFETPGSHTISVGSLPERTVTVSEPENTETLVVDGDLDGDDEYATIQAGVDNATVGDTVHVRPGTYRESVHVSTQITITAPNGATLNGSTIDGHGFSIERDSGIAPTISGFTITDYEDAVSAGRTDGPWRLENLTLRDNHRGVGASSADGDWTIRDSRIENNTFSGIGAGFQTTGDWLVENATVTGNPRGLIADGASGAWQVNGSRITANDRLGISAVGTDGAWSVNGSSIHGNGPDAQFDATGIDARDAAPQGDATDNWWGSASGPDSDDCAGNVDCSAHLGSSPDGQPEPGPVAGGPTVDGPAESVADPPDSLRGGT